MIAQGQFINALLTTKDTSILTLNNIGVEFFSDYVKEFTFIKNHIDTYGNIPDEATFVDKFPDFDLLPVTESIDYLVDELYEDRNKRKLATTFNKVRELLQNDKTDEAVQLYLNSASSFESAKHLNATNIIKDISRYDDYLARCGNINAFFVKTGLAELDKLIGGWDRLEEYATIVARTNMGKTWLLLFFAYNAAKQGLKVGIYSGEMSANKIGYRIDTFASHISNYELTHGNSNSQVEYAKYFSNIKNIFTNDILVLTPNDVGGPCGITALNAFIQKYKLDILFIDQHSLLEDDRHAKTPVEKAANISKDIKLLQVKSQIPIITVSQQNRTKSDNGVDTTMIAQSDRIGQDSTTVIFFEQDNGVAKIQLIKARDAANCKKLSYAWDIDHGVFSYIPVNDGDTTDKQQCADLKKEFDECSGANEF